MLEEAGITDASSLPRVPLDGHISLWRGNITTLRVDAIVNAANSQMLGCWVPGHYCIDNAIHAFAGVQLRLECAKLMEEQGHPEPTGMAKVIDAFNLPALYIIHTVGPIADGSPTELDKQLLANCYESCLEAAEKSGCESIAFCCISTGVFGFPQEAAAMIAIDTVRCWLDKRGSNMHVIFNVFKPEDERIYHEFLFDAER
jgi:O-acetyl-ADP-ribose deacetylase (regulator of RNase III)